MEENKETQKIDNQQEKTRREQFMEHFGQRHPDVDAGDEEAFYDALGDEWDRMDRSDAAQRELGELLASDPRSAGFLMVMRKGGNPMEYLIEQYGDDFREALNDEAKATGKLINKCTSMLNKAAQKGVVAMKKREQAQKLNEKADDVLS